MTTPRPGSRAEQRRRTEARILDAAASVFVGAGYERATIRAVASAAGVDAGLVMHYFGSKQELYRRVIDAAPLPEVSGAPEEAAEQILATLAGRLASEPTASLALLRSMLTNPEAASVASVGMARYQAQIAQVIPADDASLRAAIISAIILGVTVSRHLSSPTTSRPPTRPGSSTCCAPACSRWQPRSRFPVDLDPVPVGGRISPERSQRQRLAAGISA